MSELQELGEMLRRDPERLKQLFLNNPALRQRVTNLATDLRAGEKPSMDSFRRIYAAFFNRDMPYVDEPVVEAFIWALENHKGVMYESWRGRGKSTFFTAWGPSVMGWRPLGSTVLVRVNDGKAQEMGKTIAAMIQTNAGWRRIFPHVVPDERAGWSVEKGFNVMDTRIVRALPGEADFEKQYGEWRAMCLADHLSEQSLMCIGVESGSAIGLHPTNGEWFDDLHDEQNTSSQAELNRVVRVVRGNFFPTLYSVGGSPTLGVFCTPWSKTPPDAYQVMLETGLFKHIKTPIFTPDVNGEVFPPTGQKVKLAWPEVFPMERVVEMFNVYKTEFGKSCLCDVELSKPRNFRYQSFPFEEIRWKDWPMVVGVDPVGVYKAAGGTGISHFAMAYALKTHYNTVVIGDGVVEKCTGDEGERLLLDAQRTYYATFQRASIESNGVGAGFVAIVTRNKGLRVNAHKTNEIGSGSKQERQYRFLQPLFANGSVMVSNAETPFLNAVRTYLDTFPNIDATSYLWDVGDALVLALYDIPEIWTRVVQNVTDNKIWVQKEKKPNPYAALLTGRR